MNYQELINNHLNVTEDIADNIKEDVTKIIEKIKMNNYLTDLNKSMTVLSDAILTLFTKKYIKKIYKESRSYTDAISNDSKKEI